MIRLVQMEGPAGRRLAVVDEPLLRLVDGCASIFELARKCIEKQRSAAAVLDELGATESVSYDEVYSGASTWKLLPAADHPEEPARCLVKCINIYSYNKFMSYDLDFVSHGREKDISTVLTGLGFKKKGSRHFIREDCPFFVEFVSPPLAIGNEPVKNCEEIDTPQGTIVLLTPTDCVKDRLAAYYHWNDPQALNQAIAVVNNQEVDLKEVKRWSIKEGHEEKFKKFKVHIKKGC